MTELKLFYYVLEETPERELIVRAAQTRLRHAVEYTQPHQLPARFIVGPMTADDLHRLYPKTECRLSLHIHI